MESSSQDRNLPASERKLQKARDDGQVTRSQDLSHIAVLGSGSLALMGLAPLMFEHLKLAFSKQLVFDFSSVRDTDNLLTRLSDMVLPGLVACVSFAAIVMLASVISTVAVGGWVNSLKPVMPDLSRLDPLSGFKGLFTKKKLADVVKMFVITSVVLVIAALFLSHGIGEISALMLQPSVASLSFLMDWLVHGMGLLLVVVLVVAAIDIPLQSFLHKSQLKMSHQEVREEGKESDGNPQMKSFRRNKQREISQRGSVRAVPKADFVLMNPTHFAVAIQYDEKTMRAPRVVSKGADLLAMKIRDVAKTSSVPVIQSPMLARALYANAEIDQDIPAALYTAVAQVLAYVYRLKSALRGQGVMPGAPPEPFVPPELDPLNKVAKATS
jgi:flagellar biosynthetic protein FlhB